MARPSGDTALSIAAVVIVLAVLVGTIGVWLTAPDGPAAFDVDVVLADDRLEVTVANVGGEVATAVVVRATFADGTEADQTLDWLSPGESNQVVYVLDPSAAGSVVGRGRRRHPCRVVRPERLTARTGGEHVGEQPTFRV